MMTRAEANRIKYAATMSDPDKREARRVRCRLNKLRMRFGHKLEDEIESTAEKLKLLKQLYLENRT